MKLKTKTRKTRIQKILTRNLSLEDLIKVNEYIAELEGSLEYTMKEVDAVTKEMKDFLKEINAGSK